MHLPQSLRRSRALRAAAVAVLASASWSAGSTWTGAGPDATWDNQVLLPGGQLAYGNWDTLPNPWDDIYFVGFASGNPNLNGSRTVGAIHLESDTDFSIVGNTGDTLTLMGGGISHDAGWAGTATFAVPLVLASYPASIWNLDGTGGVVIAGGLTDDGTLSELDKTGSASLTFTGSPVAISAPLSLNGGNIVVKGTRFTAPAISVLNGDLSVTAGGAIKLSPGVPLTSTGLLTLNPYSTYVTASVTVDGGTISASGLQGTGTVNLKSGPAGEAALQLVLPANRVSTYSGQLTGSGSIAISGDATGEQILSAPASTQYPPYSGTVTITGGRLAIAGSVLQNGTVTVLSDGGLIAYGASVGAISGTGSIDFSNAALTVGGINASTTFSGHLFGVGSSLAKTGTGTFTLTADSTVGTLNALGGTVELNGATLQTAATIGSYTSFGALHVSNGGVLQGSALVNAGELVISGPGSALTAQTPYPGNPLPNSVQAGYSGTVRVEASGQINSQSLTVVGGGMNPIILIQDPGSVWHTTAASLLGNAYGLTPAPTVVIRNGGSLLVSGDTTQDTYTTVVVDGGTLTTGTLNGYGAVQLTDPSDGHALTFSGDSGSAFYNGTISGTGSIIKTGRSWQVLSGANSYTGNTIVAAGQLTLNGPSNASSYDVQNNALLDVRGTTLNLGTGELRADAGATIGLSQVTVNGGFIRGTGTYRLGGVTFNGSVIGSDFAATQTGPIVLHNTTIGGTLQGLQPLTFDGAVISASGQVSASGASITGQGCDNYGSLTITGTAHVDSGTPLTLRAGSTTHITYDGTLQSGDTSPTHVLGGTLINDGTITGPVDVSSGGRISGLGTFSGTVAVGSGGRFVGPQALFVAQSVRAQSAIWDDGGVYECHITNANWSTGAGSWDVNNLQITSDGKFTIELHTDATGPDGALEDWDPTHPYFWWFANSSNGAFTSNALSHVVIDDRAFAAANDLAGGTFSLRTSYGGSGNDLELWFTPAPTPEPGSAMLLGVAAGGLLLRRRTRV